MEVALTPQQRDAVNAHHGEPVTIVDEASNQRFYLVAEPAYLRLRELANANARERHEHLKSLIQAGIDSPAVSAEEVFANLRSIAERAANGKQ